MNIRRRKNNVLFLLRMGLETDAAIFLVARRQHTGSYVRVEDHLRSMVWEVAASFD